MVVQQAKLHQTTITGRFMHGDHTFRMPQYVCLAIDQRLLPHYLHPDDKNRFRRSSFTLATSVAEIEEGLHKFAAIHTRF